MLDTINAFIEWVIDSPGALIVIGWVLCTPLVLWLAENAPANEEWNDECDRTEPSTRTYQSSCTTCESSDGESTTMRQIDASSR